MRFSLQFACGVLLLCSTMSAQSNQLLGAYAFSDGPVAGRFGRGLSLSGSATGVRLPITGLSSAFTFEAWVNPTAYPWSDFWKQMPDWQTANAIYTLSLTQSGAIYFSAYQGSGGTTNYPIFTVPTLPLNVWTHVAVTFDGVKIRIYFDAVEIARRNATGNLIPTTQPMEVGADFQGRIDEVRVYSRALSAAEIALDRATPVDPQEPFQVSVFTPPDQAPGIATTPVSATFSAAVNRDSVSTSTFELRDSRGLIPASVTYDSSSHTALLAPAGALTPDAHYTARIIGGGAGVTDGSGAVLPADVEWTFRTAAAAELPRAAFAFSEGAGVSASDSTGHGNTGVLRHGVSWTTGVFGSAVHFDGINDDMQIPASDTTAMTDAFTFEAWVSPDAYLWGDLWSQYPPDDGGNVLYDLEITGSGTLYFAPYFVNAYYPMFTTATLPLHAWTHVALTYDGAALRIFFGAIEVASRAAHGSLARTPEPMEIGQWFQGALDEIRIYNRALTPGEIAIDMATPVDTRQPVISSITPASGAIGQTVTIAGVNFGPAAGSSSVSFSGVSAAISSWTNTSITVVVPPGAVSGPVVVTKQSVRSNGVTFTVVGPQIGASVSPGPGASGWNSSNVTVTFTCTPTDSPISFCTAPQAISFGGEGIKVTGRAVDQNGVTATMIVMLNVDLAGPNLSVYSPRTTAVFPPGTASVQIQGSAVDVLSGLSSVGCAGAPAEIVGQNFSCGVSVHDGTNAIQIVATDRAGRSTNTSASILVADLPPQSLTISPATFTLLAGSAQALAVTDERGRGVTGGTWSSNDGAVALVTTLADVPTVQALSPGTSTLTFTINALSAQTAVTVLPADTTPPDGTVLWSLTRAQNDQPGVIPGVREVLRAVPIAVPENSRVVAPSLFFVERGPYYQNQNTTVTPTAIRAVAADGRQLWSYLPPADPVFGGYQPVRQAIADDRGGIVMLMASSKPVCCYPMNEVIRRIDGLSGEVSWEYAHREAFGRFSEVALHPNGTVYVVEKLSKANSTDLVGIDGLTGAERSRIDLTGGRTTYPSASNATGPVVQDDGTVVAVASRWDNITLPSAPRSAFRVAVVDPTAPASFEELRHPDGTRVDLGVGDILSGPWPDGDGGFIVGDVAQTQTSGFSNIVHVGADLVTTPAVTLPYGTSYARDLQYVLGDDGSAYVLVQYWEGAAGGTAAKLYRLDRHTLAVLTSTDLTGGPWVQLTAALQGGGAQYTSHLTGDSSEIGYGLLAGWDNATPRVQTASTSTVADTKWPYRRGLTGRRVFNSRLGIFVKGQFVNVPVIPRVFFHTSIRLVPTSQGRWAQDPRFHQDELGNWFVTVSAESSVGGCSGFLVSDLNRAADADLLSGIYFERLGYPVADEERIIAGMLQADDNYLDDLPYDCIPLPSNDKYNSNAYAHGILKRLQLPEPITPARLSWFHPGWTKPVSSSEFDPH